MVDADRARSRTFVVTGAASGIGLATARRLLSADASFVSGQAIAVDGGYTAGRDHGVVKLFGFPTS